MTNKKKIVVRVTTIPISLNVLLKGQLRFLNNYYEIVAVSSAGDDLKEVEIREEVITKAINIKRDISIFFDVISLIQLAILFYKIKPFIVHANTPKASLLSMISAWLVRVPHRIYTVTGLRFEGETGPKRKVLVTMEKITCLFATKVFPEGKGVLKSLKENHITNKELKVIHNGNINGIDTFFFNSKLVSDDQKRNLRTNLNIKDSDIVFNFVGRLVSDKGINELISAFNRLVVIRQNLILLLVGQVENELDPLQSKTLSIMKTNSKIKSVGYQKDVRPYFSISDVFVFPSYREGFPNVVMQAGAMELPSIVSNISGCNEIITEGLNGTIVPPKNEEALYNAMLKMVTNIVWRKQLQKNAREVITANFECQEVWQALLKEYQLLEK